MTSLTESVLRANKSSGRGSLIGYFPAGYPSISESIDASVAMCKNGVDVLELGVPYSDPVMDGLVIQEATAEALRNGYRLRDTFDIIRGIKAQVDTPVLVMTYWNPVLSFGVEEFAHELKQAGAAGLITPDLIPDEAGEWLAVSDKYELDRVFLAAPTSSNERLQIASSLSRGFVYAVSTMGITGARDEVDSLAKKVVAGVRSVSNSALTAVGIGISTAKQVAEVNEYADGAIVGSAFVKAYAAGGIDALAEKVREIAAGLAR
jgi:tryptophan synthase alpha chain